MLAHPGPNPKSGANSTGASSELQPCNSKNSLDSGDPGPFGRCRAIPIWRFPEPPIEFLLVGTRGNAQTAGNQANKCGRSSAGRAPPCQGGCREFESRRPLSSLQLHSGSFRLRAIGAAVARFPDTEEVTGSIPVSPTTRAAPPELLFFVCSVCELRVCALRVCVLGIGALRALLPCAPGLPSFILWADTLGTPATSR